MPLVYQEITISTAGTLKPSLHKGCFDLKYVNSVVLMPLGSKIFFLLKTLELVAGYYEISSLTMCLIVPGRNQIWEKFYFKESVRSEQDSEILPDLYLYCLPPPSPLFFIFSLLVQCKEKQSFLLYFASLELCLQNRQELSEQKILCFNNL